MTSTRGAALLYATATALVTSIVVYGMLTVLVAQARQGRFSLQRARARYAAEAGLAWAMEELERNPGSTFAANPDLTVDGNRIDILLGPCGSPCTTTRRLQAKVTYAVR